MTLYPFAPSKECSVHTTPAPNHLRGPSGSANCCGTSQSSCYGDHYSFNEGDMSTKKLLYSGTPFI